MENQNDSNLTPKKPGRPKKLYALKHSGRDRTPDINRVAVKSEDSNSRQAFTGIPKGLEALYVMFADNAAVGGATLTLEELDLNPRTKHLPNPEKNALVKHWPKFQANQAKALQIKKLREDETKLALKAHKQGALAQEKSGVDALPIDKQLHVVANLFQQQLIAAAFTLGSMSVEDLRTDPLSMELYKLRVQYVKDFNFFTRNLRDLGDRFKENSAAVSGQIDLEHEVIQQLREADALLLNRGVNFKAPK